MIETLDGLNSSGIDWALLHGGAAIEAGDARSDADLVAVASLPEIVRALDRVLRPRGLSIVQVWPYDIGSASIFVASDERPGGAQLDVTYGHDGRGGYGVVAPRMVGARRTDGRWPSVDPRDELLYRVVKRVVKRDPERLAEVIASVGEIEPLIDRAAISFAADHAAAAVAALHGDAAGGPRRPVFGSALRLARRAIVPVGMVVAVEGERDRVAQVADPYVDLLPRVSLLDGGPSRPLLAATARFRSGLILGSAPVPFADGVVARGDDPYPTSVTLLRRLSLDRFG